MKIRLAIWLALIVAATACNRGSDDTGPLPTFTPVPVSVTPTNAPPTPQPVEATATVAPLPEATAPVVTATDFPASNAVMQSPLFQIDWEDPVPYRPSLSQDNQEALSRLATDTIYHMSLTLDSSYQRLSGQVAVRYTNAETVPLENIQMRLFPNISDGESTVGQVRINGEPVEPQFDLNRSLMRLPLTSALQPGEQTVIDMNFEVTIPNSAGGNYGIFAYVNDVLALAHFYPMIAVFDDEGWNAEIPPPSGDVVYGDASFYLVRLTAPVELTLAASGSEISRETVGANQVVTYSIGPARDFYIAASPRYQRLTQTVGEVTVNSFTFPEYEERSAFVLETVGRALAVFEARYTDYPYTELDVVTTQTLALGVEYPGIIVLTERLLDSEAQYDLGALESTTVHEVAHQWFYNSVGNDQLDEPWIDESVTQYATLVYFNEVYGAEMGETFRGTLTGRWSALQGEDRLMPVGLPVSAYEGAEYSAIIYGRGPLFVEALADEMGQETFNQFMLEYSRRYEWEVAGTAEFQALAEETCSCELDAIFEEWVLP